MSTKFHLAADGRARPLAFTVTAGQAGDVPAFETVISRIRVPRAGPGRPRTRPLAVLADRANSSRAIRSHLRRRGIRAVIPQPSDRVGHRLRRGRLGGRPPGFDSETYKERNTVEWCINRLKQWRGLTTRTDKLAMPGPPPDRRQLPVHRAPSSTMASAERGVGAGAEWASWSGRGEEDRRNMGSSPCRTLTTARTQT